MPAGRGRRSPFWLAAILGLTIAIECLGQVGAKLWEFRIENYSSAGADSAPAIGPDGTIYIGTKSFVRGTRRVDHCQHAGGGNLHALTADGRLKWTYVSPSGLLCSPALDADGNRYFGSSDSRVYALDSQGAKLWDYPTGWPIAAASLALGSNGVIYVGTHARTFYTVQGAKGPAESPWPTFQRNSRRRGQATGSPPNPPPGSPPRIVAQPKSQAVASGSYLTLTVAAAGTPPITYAWRRNGESVPGQSTDTLVLSNVRLEEIYGSHEYTKDGDGGCLHQTDLDLGALGLDTKPLESITFTKASGGTCPYIAGIFAVSGLRSQDAIHPTLGTPSPDISQGFAEHDLRAVAKPRPD